MDRIYRPDFITVVHNFLCGETDMEREILFPSVKKVINEMKAEGICEGIIYFYICNAIQTVKSVQNVNPGSRFMDILKMLNELYVNQPEYARMLSKQTIIMIAKINMNLNKTDIGEYINAIKELYS